MIINLLYRNKLNVNFKINSAKNEWYVYDK